MDETLYLSGLAHNLPCKLEDCWCRKVPSQDNIYGMVKKPWGYYSDIYRSKTTVIKRIVVFPGQSLSYQKHQKRTEFWSVESGHGAIVLNDVVTDLQPGSNVTVPRLAHHRLINVGTEQLVVYEIQSGECDEEDIIRLSDEYGRQTF